MSFNSNITPGAPPLLWSNMQEAFSKINENFDILVATIGNGSGLSPLDFESLDTSVNPTTGNTYDLGTYLKPWKKVHVAEWGEILSDSINGVWLGDAQIKGIGLTVDLPANSTVDGNLIIDPTKTWFQSVQTDGGNRVVANEFNDTLNLISGTGISLTVDSSAESIEIDNTGILNVTAGTGISRTIVAGTANIVNTGVISLSNTGSLGSRTPGLGIHVSTASGTPLITNTGVLSITAGVGITISADAVTGEVQITNSAPDGATFRFVQVDGDSGDLITADSTSDTLNINSGYGISLTKNTTSDTITIAVTDRIDIKGSVFGDDSTKLVDAVENKFYGDLFGGVSATTLRTSETKIALGSDAGSSNQGAFAVAIGVQSALVNQGTNAVAVGAQAGGNDQGSNAVAVGLQAGASNQGAASISIGQGAGGNTQGSNAIAAGYLAGYDNQGTGSIALGYTAAQVTQGDSAVSIGWSAGQTNQGDYAIAIGYRAGFLNQNVSSIILNASGAALNSTGAGFYVNPVRSTTSSARPLVYDASTSEIFYTSTLEFINSTISTTDSSGITFDVQTTFNTDVVFENDISVAERLTLKGSRVINLDELKSVVASSTSFNDFQSRIAALV